MSTKRIVLIVLGVVGLLALIVVLIAGGIVWVAFRTIAHSGAADTARTYLRNNEKLKQDIGEVKEFGWFVTGQINTRNNDGEATLNFKVIGEQKTVNATVDLSYRGGNRGWRVTGAKYERDGRTIYLLAPYDTVPEVSPSP